MKEKRKHVSLGRDAQAELIEGINTLADSVKSTLGPKGKTVIIQKGDNSPHITKDGVTVAKSIYLEGELQNMGAQMVKEASINTNASVGDGTTTATVLTQALVNKGMDLIEMGKTPLDIKRGMEVAMEDIIEHLIENAVLEIPNLEDVATISANNDSSIGIIVADAFKSIGVHGAIAVEKNNGTETFVELTEGMEFDRGYISSHFITDQESKKVELEDPYILLYDKKISHSKELLPIMEKVAKSGRPLFIIAENIEPEALNFLVVNHLNGNVKVAAAKAPGFGGRRLAILNDIAALTGGKLFSKETGRPLDDKITLNDLGSAGKITCTDISTIIINGNGDREYIAQRGKIIMENMKVAPSNYDLDMLKTRLASLNSKAAVIHVGAASELELQEKKDRIDDAVAATRAALKEGIIPGGGVAYIRAAQEILKNNDYEPEYIDGANVVLKSIYTPITLMLENAGHNSEEILDQLISDPNYSYGFNVKAGRFEDLLKSGVVDPLAVATAALENAVSIAGTILTTECIISEISEEE